MNQQELQQELNRIAWTGKTYRMEEQATLTGPEPLQIKGCYLRGWHPYAPQYARPNVITIKVTNEVSPAMEIYGAHAGIIGHAILYPDQMKTGKPKEYPVTISVPSRPGLNANVCIRSVMFAGAWSFIETSHGGQHVIEDLRGQLIGGTGIDIRNAHDVIRISGIHFWPLWSHDENFMRWAYWNPDQKGNARGIKLGLRNQSVDWPQLDNIFIYGCHVAVQVDHCDIQINNLAVDACSVGLDVYRLGQGGGQIANYRFAGNRTHGAWVGIPVYGRKEIDRALQIGNLHLHGNVRGNVWQADKKLLQIANYYKG